MLDPNPLGGLLFDLDGTLVDTAPDMGGAINRLLQQEGKPPLSDTEIRPHVSQGSRALVRLGFGSQLTDQAEKSLIDRFLAVYALHVADTSKLFGGMDELLLELEDKKVPWGIITNKPIRYTVPLLQQLNLMERCSALVCGNTMAQRKPHPAPIILACQRAGLQPDKCVYVGDAHRDVAAGAAAGMRTAVMTWGYFDKDEDINAWSADWYCEDSSALRRVCMQANLLDNST